MAEIENLLPKDRFFRCHKSFIVGFKHIKERAGNRITLDNEAKVDLTSKKVTPFKNAYMDYMKRYVFDDV